MATRLPIVQSSGELQQLQLNDPLSPAAVGVLRVVDVVAALPANTSLVSLDSLTVNTGMTLTIPDTSTVLVQNTNHPHVPYWDAVVQVPSDFSTTSVTGVDIPSLSFSAATTSTYEIQATLYGLGNDTNGVRFCINFTGTHNTGECWYAVGISTSTSVTSGQLIGTIGGTFWSSANTAVHVNLYAVIRTTSVGSITAQVAKISAGTVTIYAGSVMRIRKLI